MVHDAPVVETSSERPEEGTAADVVDTLLDGFPGLVGAWSATGRCERLNRRWRDSVGLDGEAPGERWLDAVHPDDRAPLREALESGEDPPTFRLRGPDGYLDVDLVWEDLLGGDGEPVGRLCIGLDGGSTLGSADLVPSLVQMVSLALTSLRSEEMVRRQAAQLRGLTDAAIAINSLHDVDEILDEITRLAAEIVGAHAAVVSLTIDDDWSQSIHAVHLSESYADWRGYEGQPTGEGMYAVVCRENRPMRLTDEELRAHPDWRGFGEDADQHPPMRGWLAAPLVAADGENMGLIQLSDKLDGDEFTQEDERVLVQLAQLASVALENARLREVEAEREVARFRDEMMAGISHDMRTPLAAIVGLTELLGEDDLDLEERATMLRGLTRQAHVLDSLVRQLLDFSRIESGGELPLQRRPVDVVEVIEQVVERYEHDRRFIIGHPRRHPIADVDADRLEQVLANLVDNAVSYSQGPVRVVAGERRGSVVIDVVDEGDGIPEDEIPRLFQKFQRGAQAGEVPGTGLGLYITRAIVDAHGGELTVHSTPGIGSRFHVEFARARARR